MDKEKWQDVSRNEQETTIILDYKQKEIDLYTSREAVSKRLIRKIGNPTKVYYINSLVSGTRWTIPFDSERAVKIFSKNLLIGNLK